MKSMGNAVEPSGNWCLGPSDGRRRRSAGVRGITPGKIM